MFLRAYVQICIDGPPINNLITFGSPHGGVSQVPNCGNGNPLCSFIQRIIKTSVYSYWAQNNVIQAQYFRDASKDSYYTRNKFLTDINTEIDDYNHAYRNQIKKLRNMILIQFQNDTMVQPKESAVRS